MAAKKKNKSNKKPAVGSPAAGSNNNREKNNSNNAKNRPVQNNNRGNNKPNQNGKNFSQENKKQDKNGKIFSQENKKQDKNGKNFSQDNKKQDKNGKNFAQDNKSPDQNSKKSKQKREKNSGKPKSLESAKPRKAKKSRKKMTFREFAQKYDIGKIAAALLLAAAIVAGIVYLIVSLFTSGVKIPDEIKNAEYKGRIESSSVAIETDISAEQQKMLSKSVSVKGNKSAFKFYTNKEIVMEDYSDPALIEFGSVSSNECVLLAFLIDENGKLLYRSLGVEPGKKIGSVSLFDSVPYGKHKLTLIVNGYDPETYEKKGTQTTSVNLTIGAD